MPFIVKYTFLQFLSTIGLGIAGLTNSTDRRRWTRSWNFLMNLRNFHISGFSFNRQLLYFLLVCIPYSMPLLSLLLLLLTPLSSFASTNNQFPCYPWKESSSSPIIMSGLINQRLSPNKSESDLNSNFGIFMGHKSTKIGSIFKRNSKTSVRYIYIFLYIQSDLWVLFSQLKDWLKPDR